MPEEFHDFKCAHRGLKQLFFEHQTALLAGETQRARVLFWEFERGFAQHSRLEDELLLPLYLQKAEIRPGGALENFMGEHTKIHLFLKRLRRRLEALPESTEPVRELLDLLDDECHFKELVGHHMEREERFLFPELSRVLEEDEKERLLRRLRVHH